MTGRIENGRGGDSIMFQAVVFDIGQTLVDYRIPMNWSRLYRPAFGHIAGKHHYCFSEAHYRAAEDILTKYNTRIYPREYEVSSTQIFTEIVDAMEIPPEDIEQVKESFYTYFRQDCSLFSDVRQTLKTLSSNGIRLGTLSDVAYGMDNRFALGDIASVIDYIEFPFTSNDAGYRKPCPKGLLMLSEKMKIAPPDMIFVGDEEKDMACAKNAGAYAVLINRNDVDKDYGQDRTIRALTEILPLLHISAVM